MPKQYRRLTSHEKDYLVNNWEDEPQKITSLSQVLNLSPKQLRGHARYLNLTRRNVRHSWTEYELQLLDDWEGIFKGGIIPPKNAAGNQATAHICCRLE